MKNYFFEYIINENEHKFFHVTPLPFHMLQLGQN